MAILGVIAGSGLFPQLVCEAANQRGDRCVVAALDGSEYPFLEQAAQVFRRFKMDDHGSLLAFFSDEGVKEAVLAGKIEHRAVLTPGVLSPEARSLLETLPDLNPATILQALIDYFEANGIRIIQPVEFVKPFLCAPGVLSRAEPGETVLEDIRFGWERARRLADMDIGQTLVVKNRAVVAVEGMEGTDETILRAGRLGGPGTVVIKTGRTEQDWRIDLPAVGLRTIEAANEAGAAALCFEAAFMPFFQRREALEAADEKGLVVIAR
jgi:DUF1009 family protein